MNTTTRLITCLLLVAVPLACSPPDGASPIDVPDTGENQNITTQDTGPTDDSDTSPGDTSVPHEEPDATEEPTDTEPPDAGEEPITCDGRRPAGMVRKADCLVGSPGFDCFIYSSLYGAEFPGTAQGRQIFTNRDEYIALEFTVPEEISTSANGGWGYVVPQITPTFTGRNMQSISRCPGDFDQDQIAAEMGDDCYIKQSGNPPVISVRWAIEGGSSTSRCILTPGETYYYNIVYTSSPAGTPPADIHWQCGSDPERDVCSNNTVSIF